MADPNDFTAEDRILIDVDENQKPTAAGKSVDMMDAPPAYDGPVLRVDTAIGSAPPFNKGKPTNFLRMVNTDSALKGTYIIDPTLSVPTEYLPPLEEGETEEERCNLHLHSRDGSVDADIWLIGNEGKPTIGKKRTTMHVSSRDGSVVVKLNTMRPFAPFLLDVSSRDGRVTVLLPRSFHGLINLKSRAGSCTLSDELLQGSTNLGKAEGTTRFVVGDLSTFSTSLPWDGDELKAESRDGSVRVRYADEGPSSAKPGFFKRIFSG